MNRRERRAAGRTNLDRRLRELRARVEATGEPGVVHGLTDACRDCTGEGEIVLLPGRQAVGRVYHDNGCPALAGAVEWQPVPL